MVCRFNLLSNNNNISFHLQMLLIQRSLIQWKLRLLNSQKIGILGKPKIRIGPDFFFFFFLCLKVPKNGNLRILKKMIFLSQIPLKLCKITSETSEHPKVNKDSQIDCLYIVISISYWKSWRNPGKTNTSENRTFHLVPKGHNSAKNHSIKKNL